MSQADDRIECFLGAVDKAAWADVVRRSRSVELERSIKALAKEFAQNSVHSVDDRRQRQQARADVYNALVPLLREIGERHVGTSRGARYSVLGLVAGLVAASAALGMLIA